MPDFEGSKRFFDKLEELIVTMTKPVKAVDDRWHLDQVRQDLTLQLEWIIDRRVREELKNMRPLPHNPSEPTT